MNKPQKHLVSAVICISACLFYNSTLFAANDGPVLEEVIVTAQKREQYLRDVPLSIIAISGESIRAGGISRLEDMSASVPIFSFTEAVSGSDNIFMRGIGVLFCRGGRALPINTRCHGNFKYTAWKSHRTHAR